MLSHRLYKGAKSLRQQQRSLRILAAFTRKHTGQRCDYYCERLSRPWQLRLQHQLRSSPRFLDQFGWRIMVCIAHNANTDAGPNTDADTDADAGPNTNADTDTGSYSDPGREADGGTISDSTQEAGG